MLPTKRSAIALACGARTGIRSHETKLAEFWNPTGPEVRSGEGAEHGCAHRSRRPQLPPMPVDDWRNLLMTA